MKNSCISVTQPTLGGSVYTRYYIYHSLVHIIYALFICMKQRLFKSCYCYVYFCHLKNLSNIMKNIVNYISIYSWEKVSLLTHMRNKCAMREINLYFLTLWKLTKFFLQKFIIFSVITVFKVMGNIRACKEIYLQKLVKFRLLG